jgi:hypothetical protein
VNVLHVNSGVNMSFDSLTTRGFASPYDPAAQQLAQEVVGQASWPTFTSDPGASACTVLCHLASLCLLLQPFSVAGAMRWSLMHASATFCRIRRF